MNTDLLGLAFAAGMVAAFNPCGFAMLPAYLTLVIQRDQGGQFAALVRALAATAAMAIGFLAVFGVFGLLTVSVASTVQRHLPYVTVAIGLVLVAVGLWLLSGRVLPGWSLGKGARWAPTARLGSMVGYGAGFALASLSCTAGPFLAVTGSSLRAGSPWTVAAVYASYAAGIALVVGALAVAVALASGAMIDRLRRALPYVNRVSGAILVPVGLYVAYYGWYELRLFGSVAVDTGPDPVITAAGGIQRALAGWVYQSGGWPWVLALGTLAAVAVGSACWRRRGARRGPAATGPARLDSPT
jgi:cytochrome c biogenesis protein CcdA